jgi:hypothetical protein
MNPTGAVFLAVCRDSGAPVMRISYEPVSEWFYNFDDLFLHALGFGLIATFDPALHHIVLERP